MIPVRAMRRLITMLVLISAAAGCGGSTSNNTTEGVASRKPSATPAIKACGATFEHIIRGIEALPPDAPANFPAWVEEFMSRNAHRGLPTDIGRGDIWSATAPPEEQPAR